MKTVAVITSTTGRDSLRKTAQSVQAQTYPCQHYVIYDGVAKSYWHGLPETTKIVELPNRTGLNGIMNGAVCAMSAFIAVEDYICWIDDDNWLEPNHIESLMSAIGDKPYAYSLRNLVDTDGNFWMQDNYESLGHHGEMIGVNCFVMRRDFAIKVAPLWYNTTGSLMIGDRYVFAALKQNNIPYAATGLYTVNYALNPKRDLRPYFFLGNIRNRALYPSGYPWAI